MSGLKMKQQDTKKVFWELRTCSRSFFFILNREFGYPQEIEEFAANPLAGGIRLKGHQCGMLWGATLAVGAEAFRRHEDHGQAITSAIIATQHLMESFSETTESINCRDITGCDFSSKRGIGQYLFSGKFLSCFSLAEKWAPKAIESAREGLKAVQISPSQQSVSCASLVAQKMGASDEEKLMVAGFAGGLGLSGNACGALSAAIWMNALARRRKRVGSNEHVKTTDKIEIMVPDGPRATATIKAFCSATDSKMLCHEITGQYFKTIEDHINFINNGGCAKLIDVLAST